MFQKIANLLIADSNDDIYVNETPIEIEDFHFYKSDNGIEIITFYIKDMNNHNRCCGVSFTSKEIEYLSDDMVRDKFILSLT